MRAFKSFFESTPQFKKKPEFFDGCRIIIKGHHGNALFCEEDGQLHFSYSSPYQQSIWTVVYLPSEKNFICFRSAHGKYLCDNQGIFVANREIAGDWELYVVEPDKSGSKVAIKSKQGR